MFIARYKYTRLFEYVQHTHDGDGDNDNDNDGDKRYFLRLPFRRFVLADTTRRFFRPFVPPFDNGLIWSTCLPSPFFTRPAFAIRRRAVFLIAR